MEKTLSPLKVAMLGELRKGYTSGGERGDYVILEGRNLVDACRRHGGQLKAVVLVGQSHADLEADLEGEFGGGVEVIRASQAEAREITGFPFHRGVLGLADRPMMVPLERLLESVPKGEMLVVCPELGDPGNLGAIVRCAVAFGAAGVVVGRRGPDVFGRKAMRGSAGGVFSIPIAECDSLPLAIAEMAAAGIEVVGADGGCDSARSVDDYLPTPDKSVAVVLGNEGHGLTGDVLALCDEVIRIDISPQVESLNAACAAAVLLHAIRGKGRREPGSCSV
ncbi:MAG: RNA methyltransferase, partial [Verrucomicrobiales bacterium]|nr:RNA methyltransferase [Verrucomicrobiales bacterium]